MRREEGINQKSNGKWKKVGASSCLRKGKSIINARLAISNIEDIHRLSVIGYSKSQRDEKLKVEKKVISRLVNWLNR